MHQRKGSGFMNMIDLVVLGMLAFCTIRGTIKGFVMSLFSVVSFFVAALGAALFYPVLSGLIIKTPLYHNIENNIADLMNEYVPVLANQQMQTATAYETIQPETENTAGFLQEQMEGLLSVLPLPNNLKDTLAIPTAVDMQSLLDIEGIIAQLSGNVAVLIINILSIIILFFILKLLLWLVAIALDQFMKLPILQQINKLAGGAFGFVNGLLFIYIVFSIITLISPMQAFEPFIIYVKEAASANIFYHRNILLELFL